MTSFSHGFFRFEATGLEALSSNIVEGMSLIPGIGSPDVISRTISWKVWGYGAEGSSSELGGSGSVLSCCAGTGAVRGGRSV